MKRGQQMLVVFGERFEQWPPQRLLPLPLEDLELRLEDQVCALRISPLAEEAPAEVRGADGAVRDDIVAFPVELLLVAEALSEIAEEGDYILFVVVVEAKAPGAMASETAVLNLVAGGV